MAAEDTATPAVSTDEEEEDEEDEENKEDEEEGEEEESDEDRDDALISIAAFTCVVSTSACLHRCHSSSCNYFFAVFFPLHVSDFLYSLTRSFGLSLSLLFGCHFYCCSSCRLAGLE
jgi:hypothetical protein